MQTIDNVAYTFVTETSLFKTYDSLDFNIPNGYKVVGFRPPLHKEYYMLNRFDMGLAARNFTNSEPRVILEKLQTITFRELPESPCRCKPGQYFLREDGSLSYNNATRDTYNQFRCFEKVEKF